MALTKTITVGDKEIKLKASAAVPRVYRMKFGRDIYKDLRELEKTVEANDENASSLDAFSLEMFENIAYVFNKLGDPDNAPDSVDDWLDQFETFSIYQILPEIIDLWGLNTQTQVDSKKKPRKTEREMTTPLFLLRCVQLGISIRDLDLLTVGMVNDMFCENSNDSYDYPLVATQEDMDRL